MAKPATPPIDLNNRIEQMTWPKGQVIHRIHPDKYDSAQFNPSELGNARFSPIRKPNAEIIPTIYGGDVFECAAMETVFHDVPHRLGLKVIRKDKIASLVHSEIAFGDDLSLIDLRSIALRKFGLERKDIIDTSATEYPYSRSWAEAFHAQCPDAQGLYWVSRQADHTVAIVLFEDRIAAGSIDIVAPARSIISGSAYSLIQKIADSIDVQLV